MEASLHGWLHAHPSISPVLAWAVASRPPVNGASEERWTISILTAQLAKRIRCLGRGLPVPKYRSHEHQFGLRDFAYLHDNNIILANTPPTTSLQM